MTIGLFGGTFDPVHVGHLDVARAARAAASLDAVWLVPARLPPHRRPPFASAAHRFAMAALAAASEPGVLVSDLEMDAPGPSYTADTLDRLEARGCDLRTVCFVIGVDAFHDIAAWKDYPRVVERCDFVVVSRPGFAVGELRRALPGLAPRMTDAPLRRASRPGILLVDAPTSAVSSTDVRQAIRRGASLDGLLPPAVAGHIRRHGLYRERAGTDAGQEPHEDTVTPAS
jgi:nicotinate-nucleotide adenylyltransferase